MNCNLILKSHLYQKNNEEFAGKKTSCAEENPTILETDMD